MGTQIVVSFGFKGAEKGIHFGKKEWHIFYDERQVFLKQKKETMIMDRWGARIRLELSILYLKRFVEFERPQVELSAK